MCLILKNSGHEGTWSDNAADAMVFDKSYFKELFNNAWHPRQLPQNKQDWTLDNVDPENPRMMLNTDLCLVYDIERAGNDCCTREGECLNYPGRQCPIYDEGDRRRESANAVIGFIGDSMDDEDNMVSYFSLSHCTNRHKKQSSNNTTSSTVLLHCICRSLGKGNQFRVE